MIMQLTKEQAIKEHRKMWNWIADQYKNRTDLLNETECVDGLKRWYIYMTFPDETIEYDCFCCEYDYQYDEIGICKHCPLEWDSMYNVCMCVDKDREHDGLYGLICDFNHDKCSDNDFSYCADLARQIAKLPDRKC